MKCESCNEREATIAFTRIAGDDKQVLHLCANCAESIARQEKGTGEEMGETQGGGGRAPAARPPAGDSASEPIEVEDQVPSETAAAPAADQSGEPPVKKVSIVVGNLSSSDKAVSCSGCGMTYEEFRKVGRFGCAACYSAFAPHLTLGRIRSSRNVEPLAAMLDGYQVASQLDIPISEVLLIHSDLGRGGPTYTTIHRSPLR